MTTRFTGILLCFAASCWVPLAGAGNDQASLRPSDSNESRLHGPWSERGIDLSFGYVNEWLHNLEGGQRSASAYADQIMIGAEVDLSRLAGWPGATFNVVVTNRNGPQLDAEAGLGTLLQTHEIFGRGHYTRLTRFYLSQRFGDGKLLIKLGRGDVDFFPFSCDFINISFCGALPGYHSEGWYTWPISQAFMNVTMWPAKDLYFKIGANEVNPRNLEGDQGLRLTTPDDEDDGTLANLEFGWTPNAGGGRPGAYRFGYWRDSTDHPDLLLDRDGLPLPVTGGEPRMQDESKGHYLMLQQQLISNASEGGLVVFANYSRSETNVSQVDRLVSVGLWYTGLFPSRPADRAGLALGQTRVGRRFREFERISGALTGQAEPARGSEKPMEINYAISVAKSLWLMPSLQYVQDPGGREDADSLRIIGIKLLAEL